MVPDSYDAASIDCDAFFRELRSIRLEAEANLGEEDIAHLRKTMLYGRVATTIGLATAWFPNPISMVGLAIGRSTNWFVMHHIAHRGYDRVPGIPPELTSRVYGKGWRRFLDWPDWMHPEAWKYEHNVLHHTHTSEERDPDLVERNMIWLRDWDIPRPFKLALVGLLGMTWKPAYYAPSTVHTFLARGETLGFTGKDVLSRPTGYRRMLWLQCYAPYALLNFVALPAAYLPLGPLAATSAFINSLGAEALTNLHSFAVITPNHTGDDLYAFETPAASKAEAAVRQVLGSVNYATGSEVIDFSHMWLNYQIEHHLFPDLPMLRYRQIQPKVKALCEKHGLPYIQESLWKRVKQLVGIAIGTKSMKRVTSIGRRRDLATAAE